MANSVLSGITFAVADVTPATVLLPEVPYLDVVTTVLSSEGNAPLESCSCADKMLVGGQHNEYIKQYGHGFIRTVNLAYDGHRPLILSPDMIWLLIAQGVAQHVSLNAESLRSLFVSHAGKLLLKVRRDEFIMGFVGNDWEGVFAEWSAQIAYHVGPQAHGVIVQEFSTTGIVEKAAMEITLMDAFQSYFDYSLVTLCGIPAITLEGTPDDWERLAQAVEQLSDYDLDWWTMRLRPVLEQFSRAAQGNADPSFWQDFYKQRDESGGPYISGHIINFFPYLKGRERLPMQNSRRCERIQSDDLSSGLSLAPFTWDYYRTPFAMELVAGFVGTSQDSQTLALRPEIGWAVRDATKARTAALPYVAVRGDVNLVREMLLTGAESDALDEYGRSALIIAAEHGLPAMVQLLLDFKANTSLRNTAGETALDIAKRSLAGMIEAQLSYRRLGEWAIKERERLEKVATLLGGMQD